MFIFFSCNSKKENEKESVVSYSKETLQKINKVLVNKDEEAIKSYIQRRGWDMKVTNSGLWYMVYKKGTGSFITEGDYITIDYDVWLMDGTLCYSSDESGCKNFVVGKGGVESGLEEGVLFLQKGSKARYIIPPHLAHGLIGDENKIPARATIVYDLEVKKVEK